MSLNMISLKNNLSEVPAKTPKNLHDSNKRHPKYASKLSVKMGFSESAGLLHVYI